MYPQAKWIIPWLNEWINQDSTKKFEFIAGVTPVSASFLDALMAAGIGEKFEMR